MKWFVSRHVRFLEAELIRIRLEKDAQIRDLREEKTALLAKIDKLELAVWPLASRAGAVYAHQDKPVTVNAIPPIPATTYAQAMVQHIQKLEQEDN